MGPGRNQAFVGAGAALAVLGCSSPAAGNISEGSVQSCLCAGMEQEWHTSAGTFVDCLSADFAIEIDRSNKWAEAIGQALHYAAETGKRAKIILFCDEGDETGCISDRYRLEGTVAHFDFPISLEFYTQESLRRECPWLG